MILTTERLTLREFTENDAEAVQQYAGNSENVRFMLWGPNDESQTAEFVRRAAEKAGQIPREDYDFAVCLKETGEMIGGCGLYVNEKKREAYLGWILNKRFWKNRYGTELADALLVLAFEQLNMHRVYATCDAENYGSYRVMERNGMRREAHFLKNRKLRGEWRDELLYAILEDEWRRKNA